MNVGGMKGEKDYRGISVEPEEVLMERANKFVDYIKRESIHSTGNCLTW
jgi:hypothetical protein